MATAAAALAAAAVAVAATAAGAPGCRAVVCLDQQRKALLVGVGGVIARCYGSSPGAFTAPSAAPSLAGAFMAVASADGATGYLPDAPADTSTTPALPLSADTSVARAVTRT